MQSTAHFLRKTLPAINLPVYSSCGQRHFCKGIIIFLNSPELCTEQTSKTRDTGEGELTDKNSKAPPDDEIVRVRLPQKRNLELFGFAELMMGANLIRIRCFDGVTRMGRIKGKIKKKVWIREGDILIIIPWNF